jgi:hypothetical protein
MVRAGHGCGMASVNQTRPHCVIQMGKKYSKPLVVRHGRGTAWARHAMRESALMPPRVQGSVEVNLHTCLNSALYSLKLSHS